MSKFTTTLNKPASIGTDLLMAGCVALGAGLFATLFLTWVPIFGSHMPGFCAGVFGFGYYARARKNSPINWNNSAPKPQSR